MTENQGNKPQRIGSGARLDVSSSPTRTQDLFSSAQDRLPGTASFSADQQLGPYRIVRCLGRGGMGEVYEAEDQESGRHVALKILNKSLSTSRDIERFLREGRLAASINHPNSVYIFGTEELQGTPVIAMELVKGGTLKERVEQGPLGATEAVDIILQIISGLQAAEAAGVLHRDIKPANCFIDVNGTAKIGDFGLSISTEARAETQLTMAGSFIGTPAFASPEQLRGDPLDVRSDIYSVGATLYYLLTARPPFEESNAIKLVTAIIQEVPESPAKLRPGLPAQLAAVVLRCLEKDRAKRFSSYGDLRDKLLPLGSAAALPANLAVRFVAGFIDALVTGAVFLPWMIIWNVDFRHPSNSTPLVVGGNLVACVYYGLLEGRWGASLGKLACRLRVVGPDRGLPGVPRAVLRAAISMAPATLLQLFIFRVVDWSEGQRALLESTLWISGALLFVTARRSNGFAGIHELISRTRVVSQVQWSFRPIQKAVRGPQAQEEIGTRVGPYSVIGAVKKTEGCEVLVGHDERLRRNVWIELVSQTTPTVSSARRDLGRPARLRWLNGRRSDQESWDAYEAIDGKPLQEVLTERQSWSVVRYWLLDLAEELHQAMRDRTLLESPQLGQVWITPDGSAKLVDLQTWPGAYSNTPLDPSSVQAFLYETVSAAKFSGPLPAAAWSFIAQLRDRSFSDTQSLVDALRRVATCEASVSRRRRFAHVACCAALPIFLAASTFGIGLVINKGRTQYPEIIPLRAHMSELNNLEQESRKGSREAGLQRDALELTIGQRFRPVVADTAQWSTLYSKVMINEALRKRVEELVGRRQASAADLDKAKKILGPILEGVEQRSRRRPASLVRFLVIPALMALAFVGALAVISAFLGRGGLLLRLFGIAVVTRDGTPISRLRAVWRTFLAWSPLLPLVLFVRNFRINFPRFSFDAATGAHWFGLAVLACFLVGAVWAVMRPERGLHDRVAGTWLVPK